MLARTIVALAALLALAAPTTGAAAEVDPEKRALILQLLEVSGGTATTRQVAQVMLLQIQVLYPSMVDQVMAEETQLDEADRTALRERLADFDRFALAFLQRFPERIDLTEVLRTAYIPLYDRSFELEELRQIVAFYSSPVGRKIVAVMPTLMEQGIETTIPLVQPSVAALVGEILAEERARALP